MSKAAEWTTRLVHENQMHSLSSFLTLTFNDEYLPPDYSVNIRDIQLFIKRYRKHLGHDRIRYFACGEYGDNAGRPHYHLLIFGHEFLDKKLWRRTSSGELSYRSETLERLWPFGHCEVGSVTMQSINYVARYMLKKVTGEAAEQHYLRVHPLTGELHQVQAEFVTMSSRPGIGSDWYDEFARDAFPSDFVVIDGQKRQVPVYYKRKLSEEEQTKVTRERKRKSWRHKANNTPERRAVREEVLQLKVARLRRELDESK